MTLMILVVAIKLRVLYQIRALLRKAEKKIRATTYSSAYSLWDAGLSKFLGSVPTAYSSAYSLC